MSNKKVLLLALICGLLTAVALNYYLKSVKDAATNVKTRKIVVATVRIPARTLVTADMVVLKDIPAEFVHGNAVKAINQVVGTSARAEIEVGEQVLQTKLVSKQGTGPTMAYMVPHGMRAVSVTVDEQTGVAGLITPGDRVDIVGTMEMEIPSPNPNESPTKVAQTFIIMQNAEVLAVGQNYSNIVVQGNEKKEQAQGASTITIAVPLVKVQNIVAVANNQKGKVSFVLRSPGDKSEEEQPPAAIKM